MRHQERGFTLIEVLVVITILTILAALIVPRIMDRPDQARVTAAKNDIRAIGNALNLYRLDNSTYPSTEQGLKALIAKPNNLAKWDGPYLDKALPLDPWGHPYTYKAPGEHGEFDLASMGRDGRPGGDGLDADITNW